MTSSLQPGDYNLIKNQCESHNFPHRDNKFTFEAVTVNKIETVFEVKLFMRGS
jgi:hypothetical protein